MSIKHLWRNKNSQLGDVFFSGRNHQIMPFILTLQYCIGISPEVRSCFDLIFLCKEDDNRMMHRLYEHYGRIFENFNDFKKVYEKITSDNKCMVIDNRSKSSNIKDKIFSFKIPDLDEIPDFVLASNYLVENNNI